MKDSENLAKDLKIAVKSAKAGLITLDAGRLAKKREHCMNLVSKVVPNLDDVPPTLRKELVDAASDCAYDSACARAREGRARGWLTRVCARSVLWHPVVDEGDEGRPVRVRPGAD